MAVTAVSVDSAVSAEVKVEWVVVVPGVAPVVPEADVALEPGPEVFKSMPRTPEPFGIHV
ncbi:hypothetical protein [Nitratifractor salsuginis]|uniref:hypothetical protein n=1 Tax=Nitratifractor salsuginis TaxID=269261 RepID=UPI000302210E|nr:hypothetical protein [Nitratifractor salsuginis]